tara:strand:- start:63 stop:569 length:507 start_codon:yes stop_codon:yes gene_type:complete
MKFWIAQDTAAWSSRPSFSERSCSDAPKDARVAAARVWKRRRGRAGDDEPLRHALEHGALVLVEAAELGLRLRAREVEAPRLAEEVVRREDRGLERLGRDVRAHGLVGVLDDGAASEQVVEAGHLLRAFEETQRVEGEGTRLTGDQRESDDACEHGGVSTLRVCVDCW